MSDTIEQRENAARELCDAILPLTYCRALAVLAKHFPSPAPKELPDHWGHWIDRDKNHWWIFGRPGKFMAQLLDPETGLPDDEMPSHRLREMSGRMRGGWQPAFLQECAAKEASEPCGCDPPCVPGTGGWLKKHSVTAKSAAANRALDLAEELSAPVDLEAPAPQPTAVPQRPKRVTGVVRDMLAILESADATEDEKDAATSTIVEAIAPRAYPSAVPQGERQVDPLEPTVLDRLRKRCADLAEGWYRCAKIAGCSDDRKGTLITCRWQLSEALKEVMDTELATAKSSTPPSAAPAVREESQ